MAVDHGDSVRHAAAKSGSKRERREASKDEGERRGVFGQRGQDQGVFPGSALLMSGRLTPSCAGPSPGFNIAPQYCRNRDEVGMRLLARQLLRVPKLCPDIVMMKSTKDGA